MTVTKFTERKRVGDVLQMEFNQQFCRSVGTLFTNNTGGSLDFPIGSFASETTPGNFVPSPDDSSDGILLTDVGTLANGATAANVVILYRGPAIIVKDQLTKITSAILADILISLAAKQILTVSEPIKQTTQI